jgi:hypothetical protein
LILTVEREFIGMDSTKANREVNDATVDNWCEYTCRELSNNLSKEVRTHRIHIIVDLSQEHRSLIGENQYNVLDRVEGDGHSHEE